MTRVFNNSSVVQEIMRLNAEGMPDITIGKTVGVAAPTVSRQLAMYYGRESILTDVQRVRRGLVPVGPPAADVADVRTRLDELEARLDAGSNEMFGEHLDEMAARIEALETEIEAVYSVFSDLCSNRYILTPKPRD